MGNQEEINQEVNNLHEDDGIQGNINLNQSDKFQTDNNDNSKFPYAELMLDNIRSEYEHEIERKTGLDTKAAAFVSVNIMLITLLLPMIPWDTIKGLAGKEINGHNLVAVVAVIGLVFSSILFIVSFVLLVQAAGINKYKSVNVDSMKNYAKELKSDNSLHISAIQTSLVLHYCNMLMDTGEDEGLRTVNTKRAFKLNRGIIMTVIGYFVLLLSIVLLQLY